jgi:putative tryptophan/tyrosine transport system substrate-binding protein
MRRREFITLLGGAVVAPLAARAQQPPGMRRIGVLMGGAEHDLDWQRLEAAFEQELKSLGWQRGRDIRIDYRWPGDEPDRVAAHAIELIEMGPELIVTAAATGVQAVRRRTDAIPVVFVNAAEPVRNGLVANLARPGGNVTGFAAADFSISEAWLNIIKEIAPRTAQLAVVFNPETATQASNYLQPLEPAARSLKTKAVSIPFTSESEVEKAIDAFARQPNGALIAIPDSSTALCRRSIIETANKRKLPAVFPFRFFAADGGLASYGADIAAQCRGAASYVDRILRGANPGDLPVQPAAKYEFVINQKTAKALNIAMPPALLARADEVID